MSSIDAISYVFKTIFYGIAMAVLVVIGLVNIYKYFRKAMKITKYLKSETSNSIGTYRNYNLKGSGSHQLNRGCKW